MKGIRACLAEVLDGYLVAKNEVFAHHPLAHVIRHDLRSAVESAVVDRSSLVFKGSCGQGRWAGGPWVGVFNPLVTNSAQRGYYICYLFREDMAGVYLSLNQGVTEAKLAYRSDAKSALRARAGNFRAILGSRAKGFESLAIDLSSRSPSDDTAFYEAGNICARYYSAEDLPSEEALASHLAKAVQLYDDLILGEIMGGQGAEDEVDAPPRLSIEDAAKFRLHRRVERNAQLVKDVKAIRGTVCEACGLDFGLKYGELGRGYIEAHHLVPVSSLRGRVALDPRSDFAVLCANCHRMVHRSGNYEEIEAFRRQHLKE